MEIVDVVDRVAEYPGFVLGNLVSVTEQAAFTAANVTQIALDIVTLGTIPDLYTDSPSSEFLLPDLAEIPMYLITGENLDLDQIDLLYSDYLLYSDQVSRKFLAGMSRNFLIESGRHLVRAPVILLAAIVDIAAGILGFVAATATLYQKQRLNNYAIIHLKGTIGIERALFSLRQVVSRKNRNARTCDGLLGKVQYAIGAIPYFPVFAMYDLSNRIGNIARTLIAIPYKWIDSATSGKLPLVKYTANTVDLHVAFSTLFVEIKPDAEGSASDESNGDLSWDDE